MYLSRPPPKLFAVDLNPYVCSLSVLIRRWVTVVFRLSKQKLGRGNTSCHSRASNCPLPGCSAEAVARSETQMALASENVMLVMPVWITIKLSRGCRLVIGEARASSPALRMASERPWRMWEMIQPSIGVTRRVGPRRSREILAENLSNDGGMPTTVPTGARRDKAESVSWMI